MGSNAQISTTSFVACTSASSGGALWASGSAQKYPQPVLPSSMLLRACEFRNNSASGLGGAVAIVSKSKGTIESSTFTGNSALSGGAMAIYAQSTAVLETSTFTFNLAVSGGAVAIEYADVNLSTVRFTTTQRVTLPAASQSPPKLL